jgi:hypothetical protein
MLEMTAASCFLNNTRVEYQHYPQVPAVICSRGMQAACCSFAYFIKNGECEQS